MDEAKGDGRPGLAYATVLALWIGGTALLLYLPLWFGEQVALVDGGRLWRGAGASVTLAHAALTILPALLGYRLATRPRYRAVFRAWALAAVFALLLLPAHLAGMDAAQMAAVLQIGGSLLYLGLLAWLGRHANLPGRGGPVGVAVAAGLLLALPWVAWGALGSVLDTALNLAAAALFGLAVARTLALTVWAVPDDDITRRDILFDGLVVAAALSAMGGAFGVNGQQILLLPLLPGLGWFVAWLAVASPGGRSPAVFIALATAVPLLFVDPDELNLLLNLGNRDVAVYALFATLLGAFMALALSLAVLLFARRPPPVDSPRTAALASLLGLGALALYFFIGQPGWHGERLFVILESRADLSAAAEVADPVARRTLVYDSLVAQAETSQADLRRVLDRLGVSYTPYYLVNALEVDGGPLWRLWLARQPGVARVLVSPDLRPLPEPPPTVTGIADAPDPPLWTLRLIGAPQVWTNLGITGQGIVIGQSDSGVDGGHVELRDQYRGNRAGGPAGDDYNWFDPWYGTTSPGDYGGHGTHTLGTALGRNVGVAPDATWIACVNLPRNLGNPPRYLDCLQFLLAPFPQGGDALAGGRPDLGAHVLNNSWGCPEIEGCDAATLLTAAQNLRAAGVFVVVSAGNDGDACSTIAHPLSLYDEVFTVGATDEDGVIAPFSSRGPVTADGSGRVKPDVVAPGVNILSAFPGDSYAYSDGTSMAGPHVAGVVALLWSANPALIGNVERTEAILTGTARPYNHEALGVPACGAADERPDNAAGYGLVDAYAAVQRALAER